VRNDIEDIVNFLGLVKTLRLAPPQNSALRLPFAVPDNNVTCLDLWWLVGLITWTDRETLDMDNLYSVFSIRTLRMLSITRLVWYYGAHVTNVPERCGTSNVIQLSFPGALPIQRELVKILTWRKGLKSIRFETE